MGEGGKRKKKKERRKEEEKKRKEKALPRRCFCSRAQTIPNYSFDLANESDGKKLGKFLISFP